MFYNPDKILNVSRLIEKYDFPVFEKFCVGYEKLGIFPKLSVVLTSRDEGSISYLKGVKKFCLQYGIAFEDFMAESADELRKIVGKLNYTDTNGIMILYPTGFEEKDTAFMNMVMPEKDVEGLHYSHLGYLMQYEKFKDMTKLRKLVIPPTAKGIMYLFKRYFLDYEDFKDQNNCYPDNLADNPFLIEGKRITIVNDSLAVGRSLAMMLLNENGSVQICHKYSPFEDIVKSVEDSDFVISAVPSSRFCIPTEALRQNSIVVDISFTGNFEYPFVFEKVYKIAPRWDLQKKGNRVNDMTLYRLISNLFYLINSRLPDEMIKQIED
jgi:5,10-methylene-tetrahydrofolate dehydrogenase/methenyl tetrahydrofolate cyclohydrolase